MSFEPAEISGRGVVSSSGLSVAEFGDSVLNGLTSIAELQGLNTSMLKFSTGAPVRNFVASDHFTERNLASTQRFSQFAVVAAKQAWREAGLDEAPLPAERVGVVFGTAAGGLDFLEVSYKRMFVEQKKPFPLTIPMNMVSAPASAIARELGAKGPVFSTSTACASGAHAIMLGLMLLRSNQADAVIVGGTDSCFSEGFLAAWDSLRVVSPEACRPFSRNRRGLTIGEGAAAFVIERHGMAAARGAVVRGKLLGGGMTSDAGDLTSPDRAGMRRSMELALADAALAIFDIDYINAHGTGTLANDREEAAAISELFHKRISTLAVSSTKSAFGHAMGAAGALEFLVTLLALERGVVPPTLNFDEQDPDCSLDVVPNNPRQQNGRFALSNSFAFGGLNVSLAVGRS